MQSSSGRCHGIDEIAAPKRLSEREVQVLRLICDGLPAKDIANSLDISTKTVEFHKAGIAKKIGNRSVAHMVRYAIRIGLIEP
jgi:DNA-binding CsgD family transcriptional regulator